MRKITGLAVLGLLSSAATSAPLDMKAGLQALLENNSALIEQKVQRQLDALMESSIESYDAVDDFSELGQNVYSGNKAGATLALAAG